MNLLNSSVTFITSFIEIVENKNPKTSEGQCVVCISRDNPDVLETRVSMLLCEVWYAENSYLQDKYFAICRLWYPVDVAARVCHLSTKLLMVWFGLALLRSVGFHML